MNATRLLSLKALFLSLVTIVLLRNQLWAQAAAPSASPVPALPADIPATAERYSFLLMGNLAGQQAMWTESDGTLHIFYQFNDRGRGPKLNSVLKVDANGIPVSESIAGNDYLKSPVNETYSVAGGAARWRSDAEHGEKKLASAAYYFPLNAAPAETGLLAQAALRSGGKVALLPAGEARVERAAELDIEASGQKRHVALYAVSGLDFAPSYVWLREGDRFFASVSSWATVIPEGWESAAKALLDKQNEVKQARAAELAAKLAHHPTQGILFTHADVFNAHSGEILHDRYVLVNGNRITSVTDRMPHPGSPEMWSERSPLDIREKIIDAHGKTLLPGLWDVHAHVTDNDGLLNLAAGVTTVRDLGNDTDTLLARRKRIAEGKEIGTRIVIAGIIDGRGPYQGPTKVLVSTEAEERGGR